MTPAGERVARAWRAWDARPGAEHTARAMEAACEHFAGGLSLVLRRYLCAARRAGRSYEQIVEGWEQLHDEPS